MKITIPSWVKEFAVDAGERAVKTFAGGFIYGANLVQAGIDVFAGQGTVAFSQIDWVGGLDVGSGTAVASIAFSLLSLKRGNPGTASATKAVVPASLFRAVAKGGK